MKGLKLIPMFLILILLSYLGAVFVESNSMQVEITLLNQKTPPMKMGLALLISAFVGTLITGILCSVEILALYVETRRLRRRIARHHHQTSVETHEDAASHRATR